MEDLLKAYARKRREEAGGPFVLHPATRRLLQAEVGQGRPKATGVPPSLLEMLMRSWPRLAFATSVVVAVGLIIWITSPKRDSQMNLAQAGKRPLEEVAQASGEARKDSPTTPEAGLKKPVPALGLSGPAESKAVEEPKGGAAKPNEWGLALNKAPESDSGSLDNYKKEVGERRAGMAGGGFGGGTPGLETVERSGPRSATTPLNFGANMLGEAQDRIASRPKAKLAADFGFATPTNFSSPTASTAVGAARGYAFYALGQAIYKAL